jgi:general secretion pathway protein M
MAVAGAGLEQRVTGSIVKTGGNVLSTQIDLNSADAKKGFISLIVSCEVRQPALQQVLYDLEAGMPFLFIDQLEVQPPQARRGGRTDARDDDRLGRMASQAIAGKGAFSGKMPTR